MTDRQTNGQTQRQTRSIQLQKTVKTVTEHTDDSRSTKCSLSLKFTSGTDKSLYHKYHQLYLARAGSN